MISISAHVMAKNEARFIWYSVMSVINSVDEVLIWDTGSTDATSNIIQTIKKNFSRKVTVKVEKMSTFDEEYVRQKMLDQVKTDWFIVVDADEVWWNDSIEKVVSVIRTEGDKYESIVTPTINLVGDMYHYQEEKAGNYRLLGRVGHYNLRAVSMSIPGLHSLGSHGVWGWVDNTNTMIQDRDPKKIKYLDAPYLHATFLQRAGDHTLDSQVLKRKQKHKHELGIPFPKDYFYPESFFCKRPAIVPNVWSPMSKAFLAQSLVETPLRKVKRRVLPKKVGY
jgi:glycosyltransferase involved in cell wall biosynthesis